jgi:hypothetical protein
MAVGFMFEVQGGTSAQYDHIMADLNVAENPIVGLLSHTAGPMEGGWRVIDIWENDGAFETFVSTRLQGAIERSGMPEPKLTRFDVHNFMA